MEIRTNRYNFTKKELVELYERQGMTLHQIADKKGCHWDTVRKWCHKLGIKMRNPKEPDFLRYIQKRAAQKRKLPIRKDYVFDRYIKRGWQLKKIAAEIGCDWTTIQRRCIEYGIPLRKPHKSEQARKEYFIERVNRNPKFADEKSLKVALIALFGHKCMVCGYSTVVDAHHINGKKNGNYANKALLLCPNHHRELHLGLLDEKQIQKIIQRNKEKVRHSK